MKYQSRRRQRDRTRGLDRTQVGQTDDLDRTKVDDDGNDKPVMVRVYHRGQWVDVVKPQLDVDGNVIPEW